MTRIASDFLRFLEANYNDDWRKVSVVDVEDDVVTSICSRYERKYELWRKVPEWIKDFYRDRIPNEVLDGNEPIDRFVEDVEKRVVGEYAYDYDKLLDTIYRAKVIEMHDPWLLEKYDEARENGYSSNNSYKLTSTKKTRKDADNNPALSREERLDIHIRTRLEDIKTILDDWKEGQQVKYAVHLRKEIDREERRAIRAEKDGADVEALKHRIKASKNRCELNKLMKKVKDTDIKEELVKSLEVTEKELEKRKKLTVKEKVDDLAKKPENKNLIENHSASTASFLER